MSVISKAPARTLITCILIGTVKTSYGDVLDAEWDD